MHFRRGVRTQKDNHMIIEVKDVDSREKAEKLVGNEVSWNNPIGKNKLVIKGKVTSAHGKKGAIRAIFEKGMPGQAIGTKVKVQ